MQSSDPDPQPELPLRHLDKLNRVKQMGEPREAGNGDYHHTVNKTKSQVPSNTEMQHGFEPAAAVRKSAKGDPNLQ